MNNCASFSEDLDASRDQQLSPDRQLELDEHLAQCARCRAELALGQQVEDVIRRAAKDWQATDDLWNRIEASARQKPTAVAATRTARAWVAAALLVVTIGVTSFALLKPAGERSLEIVATALVNEFHTFVVSHRDLDFNNSQPGKIRSWFGDKVDFRVPLPVATADLKPAGGRLCNMLNQRVAAFMYQVDGAWVSLYIMRSARAAQNLGASQELLLKGYGFIDWENQGLHYSLVGDLPVERLREIAEQLRATRILTHLPEHEGILIVMVSPELATSSIS